MIFLVQVFAPPCRMYPLTLRVLTMFNCIMFSSRMRRTLANLNIHELDKWVPTPISVLVMWLKCTTKTCHGPFSLWPYFSMVKFRLSSLNISPNTALFITDSDPMLLAAIWLMRPCSVLPSPQVRRLSTEENVSYLAMLAWRPRGA